MAAVIITHSYRASCRGTVWRFAIVMGRLSLVMAARRLRAQDTLSLRVSPHTKQVSAHYTFPLRTCNEVWQAPKRQGQNTLGPKPPTIAGSHFRCSLHRNLRRRNHNTSTIASCLNSQHIHQATSPPPSPFGPSCSAPHAPASSPAMSSSKPAAFSTDVRKGYLYTECRLRRWPVVGCDCSVGPQSNAVSMVIAPISPKRSPRVWTTNHR